MTTTGVPKTKWDEWHGYAPLDATAGPRVRAAFGDIGEGFRRWRLWWFLALDNMRNAYRRTVVGPWWLTLQTAIHVAALSLLFGAVFHLPLRTFMPYVGIGYVVFTFLAGMVRAGTTAFTSRASSITSSHQPLSVIVLQDVAVEFLQFLHNLFIVAVFAAMGLLTFNPATALVFPSVALMVVNGVAMGLWLGPLVARFRDVQPIVDSIVRLLAFFTPIFWLVDTIRGQQRSSLLGWNPFYYLLESFRGPLLGEGVLHMFIGVLAVTGLNIIAALWVFSASRSHVPYWVA